MAIVGLPIGLVVQSVAHHHSSVAAADAIALFGLVGALSGPLIGQANDRSQKLLLRYRLSLGVFVAATLLVCRRSDVSDGATLIAASLSGVAAPMTGSSWSGAAARLAGVGPGPRLRAYDVSTYAFAAIASPVMIGVLGPVSGPAAPLVMCAGFAVAAAATSLLLRTGSGETATATVRASPRPALPHWRTLIANWSFVALLLVTMGMQPIAVAATLNSPLLSTQLFGSRGEAGLILAILSVGTLVSSLSANSRVSSRVSTRTICVIVVAAAVLLPTARPGWLGVPCLFTIGVGNGLLLVATFARVDQAFGVERHSEIFAFAETSRMLAASAASWSLGGLDLSGSGSMLLSVVPMAGLLVLPLSTRSASSRRRRQRRQEKI